MFAINESGDGSCHSETPDFLLNPLRFSTQTAQPSIWRYRRFFGGNFQTAALPISMYGKLLRPSMYYGTPAVQAQPPYLQTILPSSTPALACYQNPKLIQDRRYSKKYRVMQPSPSFSMGAGDGPQGMPPCRPIVLQNDNYMPKDEHLDSIQVDENSALGVDNSSTKEQKEEVIEEVTNAVQIESEVKLEATSQEEGEKESSNTDADTQKKRMQHSLEKFLLKIVELYDKLRFRNCYSSTQYKDTIKKLLTESRHYFYKLESTALCEILKENDKWDSTDRVAEIFHHDYFSMADILAVYLLQLIHAYSEYGFINIDPSGSNPLSMSSFYRGEFRIGRVLPGIYQMHVTSYHYTACTKMLQVSDPCPLKRDDHVTLECGWQSGIDVHADLQHWSECGLCDPFHAFKAHKTDETDDDLFLENTDLIQYVTSHDDVATSQDAEDASSLLKMLSWRVRFMQNPDLEEENYYLCCKAIKPYFQEPEYIFQSDSFQYFFGKLVSPKLNFTNPTLEEIVLDCRPSGRFEVLHSFGHQLPLYSVAVGVLVDFLRHKRFRRTVF